MFGVLQVLNTWSAILIIFALIMIIVDIFFFVVARSKHFPIWKYIFLPLPIGIIGWSLVIVSNAQYWYYRYYSPYPTSEPNHFEEPFQYIQPTSQIICLLALMTLILGGLLLYFPARKKVKPLS